MLIATTIQEARYLQRTDQRLFATPLIRADTPAELCDALKVDDPGSYLRHREATETPAPDASPRGPIEHRMDCFVAACLAMTEPASRAQRDDPLPTSEHGTPLDCRATLAMTG